MLGSVGREGLGPGNGFGFRGLGFRGLGFRAEAVEISCVDALSVNHKPQSNQDFRCKPNIEGDESYGICV